MQYSNVDTLAPWLRLSCCLRHGARQDSDVPFGVALMGRVSFLGELTPSLGVLHSSSNLKDLFSKGTDLPHQDPPPAVPKRLAGGGHSHILPPRLHTRDKSLSLSPGTIPAFPLESVACSHRACSHRLCPADGMTVFHSFSFSISVNSLRCIRCYASQSRWDFTSS